MSMDRTIELQEHYGATVWTHKEMDELRRSECLCRLCDRLVCGDDEPSREQNCQLANVERPQNGSAASIFRQASAGSRNRW